MAQFGIHALVGLWIAWALPLFSPYILRFSFGIGIYLGCVLPDIDIYPEAISYFVDPSFATKLHRTATHSVITASILLLFFYLLEFVAHKKPRQLYDIEATALDDDALLSLNGGGGAEPTHGESPGINFRAFGVGIFAGMLIHIMLDIVFWFTAVDVLFPLSLFHVTHPVDAWQYTPPQIATTILTLSESLVFGVYLTLLRLSVTRKLGRWTESYPEDIKKQRQSFTDNDMEQSSMDFSVYAQDEICPLDRQTLKRVRPALFVSKYLIIFQYAFFIVLSIAAKFIPPEALKISVFSELMVVCVPAYGYLTWALRDVILRKTVL